MPPKARKTRIRKEQSVPAALIHYFQTGDDDQAQFDIADRYNEFLIFSGGVGPTIEDYWDLCKSELLANWIKKAPLSRPWAWWVFEQGGSIFSCENVPVNEVKYLFEHDLLTAMEKAYLLKRPELSQPEKVSFDND